MGTSQTNPTRKFSRSKVGKYALLFVVLILALMVFSYLRIWRSPPYYTPSNDITLCIPVMSNTEYGSFVANHPRPYIVQIATVNGGLLLYGSTHTNDPSDPQVAQIEQLWQSHRPTVLLVEGRLGFLYSGLSNPVHSYGEMGAAYALARQDRVTTYSWEPTRDIEIGLLLEEHAAERVALFFTLRPYFSNYRFGKPDDPDAVAQEYLNSRTDYPGLRGTLRDVADIDAIWQRDFAEYDDWRNTSDEYGLPGYLAELVEASNRARDEHFARVIIDLVQQGHRVFAVAGSSHAVKLEATLDAALNGPEQGDQGELKECEKPQ